MQQQQQHITATTKCYNSNSQFCETNYLRKGPIASWFFNFCKNNNNNPAQLMPSYDIQVKKIKLKNKNQEMFSK